MTRKCSVDGSVVGPEQAVSLAEAFRAVTIHAAGQIGMADQLGTLESGKLADLTILEQDPIQGRSGCSDEDQGERDLGRRSEKVRVGIKRNAASRPRRGSTWLTLEKRFDRRKSWGGCGASGG